MIGTPPARQTVAHSLARKIDGVGSTFNTDRCHGSEMTSGTGFQYQPIGFEIVCNFLLLRQVQATLSNIRQYFPE